MIEKYSGVVTVLALVLAPAAAATGDKERRYATRVPLEVQPLGTTNVPVDPEWRRGGFPDDGWRVVNASGRTLDARLIEDSPGETSATVTAIETLAGGGHRLVFDLGSTTVRHDRLRVVLEEEQLAQDVLLEASDDGKTWRDLARADVFRLGASAALQGSALRYPATNARFLRLTWPAEAGFPKLFEATVRQRDPEEGSGDTLMLDAIERPCPAGSRCRSYVVPVGFRADALRALAVTVDPGEAGWIWIGPASAGAPWQVATVSIPQSDQTRRLVLEPGTHRPGLVEVRTWVSEGTAPALLGIEAIFEPQRLVIEAEGDAQVHLEYGFPAAGELIFPVALPAAGTFARRWTIERPAGALAAITRVVVPDEILLATGNGLGRLHVVVDESVVAHVVENDAPFVLAGATDEWKGVPDSGGRWLTALEHDLGKGAALLSHVEVFFRGTSFAQDVLIARHSPGRAGVAPRRQTLHGPERLTCEAARPCSVRAIVAGANDGDRLVVSFPGGGVPIETKTRLLLWREERALRFVWPDVAQKVELALRADEAAAPVLEISNDDETALLRGPFTTATIALDREDPARTRLFSVLLVAALGTLALVLVFVIRRAL